MIDLLQYWTVSQGKVYVLTYETPDFYQRINTGCELHLVTMMRSFEITP